MEENKPSKAFSTASIVSLIFSGLGALFSLMVVVMYFFGGSGGGYHTAVTNEAILGIAGVMIFAVGSWIFGFIGFLMGLIITIVGFVKKMTEKIWMPILSIVLGLVPAAGVLLFFVRLSLD